MQVVFFIAALTAIAATVRVITCANAVHALLYLILSLIAIAVDFYVLGAPFSATLEVIVYAGAIMVLFVFVVMMLSINDQTVKTERQWLKPSIWIGPGLMSIVLLVVLAFAIATGNSSAELSSTPLSAHAIGANLFGPYVLVVELTAFILLAGLVVAAHLGRPQPDSARHDAERGKIDVQNR